MVNDIRNPVAGRANAAGTEPTSVAGAQQPQNVSPVDPTNNNAQLNLAYNQSIANNNGNANTLSGDLDDPLGAGFKGLDLIPDGEGRWKTPGGFELELLANGQLKITDPNGHSTTLTRGADGKWTVAEGDGATPWKIPTVPATFQLPDTTQIVFNEDGSIEFLVGDDHLHTEPNGATWKSSEIKYDRLDYEKTNLDKKGDYYLLGGDGDDWMKYLGEGDKYGEVVFAADTQSGITLKAFQDYVGGYNGAEITVEQFNRFLKTLIRGGNPDLRNKFKEYLDAYRKRFGEDNPTAWLLALAATMMDFWGDQARDAASRATAAGEAVTDPDNTNEAGANEKPSASTEQQIAVTEFSEALKNGNQVSELVSSALASIERSESQTIQNIA